MKNMYWRSSVVCLCLLLAGTAKADQWGSVVLVHCYELDDNRYQQHFFIRVFRTEVGGGQLVREAAATNGPVSLGDLNATPATCLINEKEVLFTTKEYKELTSRGAAGLSDHTGFQLRVDGTTIWEAPAPKRRGDALFNGTIDVDREMARICTENAAENIGVTLPYTPDFFKSRTSILVCETIAY